MIDRLDRVKAALAERYTVERELGAGGMATVYLALDTRHNRKVALKVLRAELAAFIGADRFLKEIETTANLQHPHILPLFDSGRIDSTVFYVMPYVEGESLRQRLSREKQLPVGDAIRIVTEVADALHYAHRHGVIHRDIKPENMLFHDGRAIVADFGIALALSRGDGSTRMTETGMSLGTPAYMSPEQAGGERTVDARSDIYALGVVLYEMLAGEPPFTGPTPQAILARVLTERPKPLSVRRKAVPPRLEAAVARALEELPADRFQTAAEFSAAVAGPGGAIEYGRPSGRPSGFLAALPWALAGVLLLVVAWLGIRAARTVPASVQSARFSVVLDPGVQPTFTPIVRLSADGRQLFIAALIDRRDAILHRPLDEMSMRAIAGAGQGEQGSENSRPFPSPDGRWIAYSAQGKLRKVSVAGGPAIDLAAAEWGGGSWGRNGQLVYTKAYNTGLWIVREGGGDARMLTTPDSTKGELGHWWPQILPDGDHVLFTAYRTPIERATIEILSIKSGQRRVVVTGGVSGLFVPTGHILYAVGETVRAVPFDVKRLSVTGAAVSVLDSVAMNPSDGAAAFDVSETGTLAYLPVSSYITESEAVLVDRRGNESRALPAADRYNDPRLSPDGSRVAVDIRSPTSLGDVWVFQVGRSTGTRLTSEGGRDWGAEWTPDGRELIYISERPFFDLYRRTADASRPAQLLLSGAYDHYTGTISRDGNLLAFVLSIPGATEIWTVPLHGKGAPVRYFANGFNLAHPALSPDGHWMAYDSDESGRAEVYAQSFPDPSIARWKVSPARGSEPLWTRGGRELVFRKGDSVMAVSMDLQRGRSGQPVALFGGRYPDSPSWTKPRSYDVSADGAQFLLLRLPPERNRPHVNIVLNWFDELKALAH